MILFWFECSCPICLNTFRHRESLITLPCKHNYHAVCVAKWLKIEKVISWWSMIFLYYFPHHRKNDPILIPRKKMIQSYFQRTSWSLLCMKAHDMIFGYSRLSMLFWPSAVEFRIYSFILYETDLPCLQIWSVWTFLVWDQKNIVGADR